MRSCFLQSLQCLAIAPPIMQSQKFLQNHYIHSSYAGISSIHINNIHHHTNTRCIKFYVKPRVRMYIWVVGFQSIDITPN